MKILVIEDEQKTAEALKRGLIESGYNADATYDGTTGFELVKRGNYDLLISDIIMPGINGIELCKKVRRLSKDIPILLLSALEAKKDIVEGLDAGADDYLTKPFDFHELLARVRAISKRIPKTGEKNPVLRFSDMEINTESYQVTRAGSIIELTSKEFKLLHYFMKNHGKVISRNELADKIWNIDFDTGTNIVEVYINYLRNKIDKPFKKKLIHNIHGIGYILKESTP